MQHANDDALQNYFLQGVSRTFAISIPVLPMPLQRVVANAYLQCRIIDTIEDDPGLSLDQKHEFSQGFVQCLSGEADADAFAQSLYPQLSDKVLDMEKELVRSNADVQRIYQSFPAVDQKAIFACVETMSKGMVHFQQRQSPEGLYDIQEMEDYCYFVAGVVGEMLTNIYANHESAIKAQQETLMPLARSFGQGLQMTNILKDIWDDQKRGVCWLPAKDFSDQGYALHFLSEGKTDKAFQQGLMQLIALAHFRLKEALDYTLKIPASQREIRQFNLWSLGMAMLTLRKIARHPEYRSGDEVKISRNSVRLTIILMKWFAGYDSLLKLMFYLAGRGLPEPLRAKSPRVPLLD